MHGPRIVVASICLIAFLPIARASGLQPVATLEVHGDAVQPADAPILLELVVHNTGAVPIRYWCGGPGEYPDAADFDATISRTDVPSRPGRSPLSNGQHSDGAGQAFTIAPGRALCFPAAVRPLLPPGEYDIVVECGADGRMHDGALQAVTWPAMRSTNVFHVTVREDKQLLAARDAGVVAKVRDHDPFARHVASTWPRRPVREELVKDLTGDDVVAADRAADGLWGDGPAPGGDWPLVARVIRKHRDPPIDGTCDIGLMTKLIKACDPAAVGSEQVREALAKVAAARSDGLVHDRAVAALDPQDRRPPYSLAQAREAAERSNFLNVLIGLSRSADPAERKIAYRRLADFPGDAAAIKIVQAGLLDDDADCRSEAAATLKQLTRTSTARPGAGP